jgi:hypothetical protein
VGDRVWLSNRNLKTEGPQGSRKMEPLYYGPYEVLEMHHSNAARLQMPAGCRLHPVFNLDLLKKYIDGREEFPDRPARHERPGPIPQEDPDAGGPGDPIYEVEQVIAARRKGPRRQYRVLWKGWPREQASWLSVSECEACAELVKEFEEKQLELRRRVQGVQLQDVARQEQQVQR